jgi:hypothetical protein
VEEDEGLYEMDQRLATWTASCYDSFKGKLNLASKQVGDN